MTKPERDQRVDLLRFIGLTMIFIAHAGPSGVVFQLRNFDVPLLVLISGVSFGLSQGDRYYFPYVLKRLRRMLFPAWIFLTFYLLFLSLFDPGDEVIYNFSILNLYLFMNGIPFLWIIRVFLLCALLAPLFNAYHCKIRSDAGYLISLFGVLLVFEAFRYQAGGHNAGEREALLLMTDFIPYSLLFAFGLRISHISRRTNYVVLLIFVLIFGGLASMLWLKSGMFVPTQLFKYPPSIYYFSYAIPVSIILWMWRDRIWRNIATYTIIRDPILFIARNSIWIYLWHIPFARSVNGGFIPNLAVLIFFPLCLTYAQVWLVDHMLIPKAKRVVIKENLKLMLTG